MTENVPLLTAMLKFGSLQLNCCSFKTKHESSQIVLHSIYLRENVWCLDDGEAAEQEKKKTQLMEQQMLRGLQHRIIFCIFSVYKFL